MTPFDVILVMLQVIVYPVLFVAFAFIVYVFYGFTMFVGKQNRKQLIKGSVLDPNNHPSYSKN